MVDGLEQPLVAWGRLATTDTEIAGVSVNAGCPVVVNSGAANHDPSEWPNPDEFDIRRDHPDRHLTFGFGKHHCLGVHLARMELDVMLAGVLDRLPDLRLENAEGVKRTGLGFRMVTSLPRVVILTMHDVSLRPTSRGSGKNKAAPAAGGKLTLEGTVKTYRYMDNDEIAEYEEANAPKGKKKGAKPKAKGGK